MGPVTDRAPALVTTPVPRTLALKTCVHRTEPHERSSSAGAEERARPVGSPRLSARLLSHHPGGPPVGGGPPGPSGARRPVGGQSLVSSLASVLVFLGFLFFAVHLVISLYATSTVTGQAYDAARRVAASDIDHSDPGALAAAQQRAEADLRGSLGGYSDRVESLDWSGSTADVVSLRVRAQNPSFLVFATSPLGVEQIDRTVKVRVERLR